VLKCRIWPNQINTGIFERECFPILEGIDHACAAHLFRRTVVHHIDRRAISRSLRLCTFQYFQSMTGANFKNVLACDRRKLSVQFGYSMNLKISVAPLSNDIVGQASPLAENPCECFETLLPGRILVGITQLCDQLQ